MSSVAKFIDLSRSHGFGKVAQVALGRGLNRLFPGPLRSRTMPSLHELDQAALETHRDAVSVLAYLGADAGISEEAQRVVAQASEWGASHARFPMNWGVEKETATFL